ncbi:MAG: tRNA lysidine(34) synthetase TilS [Phycisphaerales bacterium]
MPITLEADGRLPIALRRHPLVPRLAEGLAGCMAGSMAGGMADSAAARRSEASAPRARLVLAASGGADSTALVLAAAVLAQRRRHPWPSPLVVHVHHHLRLADADADAAFVADLANRLGLEHVRVDLPRDLASRPGNLAANARDARLDALARIAAERDIRAIVTAHHAGDQVETALLGLARGTDLARLGMAPARRVTNAADLIRPWLTVPPEELRSLCRAAGVRWREDVGNRDLRRARARLRRTVLPTLESMHPGAIVRAAASLTDHASSRSFDSAAATAKTAPGAPTMSPAPTGQGAAISRATLRRTSPAEASRLIRAVALAACPELADRLTRNHVSEAVKHARDASEHPRRLPWPAGAICDIFAHDIVIDSAPPDRAGGPESMPPAAT